MSEENPKNSPAVTGPQAFTPIDQHLFESRTIFLSGEVNSDLAVRVNRQLLAMERVDAKKPIILWIDCPGGEIFSGFSIYDTAQFIRPPVFTVIAGLAASMGSVIALTAEKNRRFALPNSKMLIHQPLIAGVMRGSASDLEIHAADIIATKKRLHQLYAERTGTPIDTFEELMERDHWIDPARAVSLGLISKVIQNRSELEALIK